MSNMISKNITCPKCGFQVATKIYQGINVTAEPTLRESVLTEKLFKWKCPACRFEAVLKHPLLYNDVKNKFMIYLIPNVVSEQLVDTKLEEEFPETASVTKRLVSSFNALKEKIMIFEEGLDDMAVELAKLAVSSVIAKKIGKNVTDGYFSMLDKEKSTIGFTFFLGENHEIHCQSTHMDIYNKSIDIVRTVNSAGNETLGFSMIDKRWAEQALILYKKILHG